MTSGQIVALEFIGVVGVVLGLGVWELVRLRRDRAVPERQPESVPEPRSESREEARPDSPPPPPPSP